MMSNTTDSVGHPLHGAVRLEMNERNWNAEAFLLGADIYVPTTLATTFGAPTTIETDERTASGIDPYRRGGCAAVAVPSAVAYPDCGCPFPGLPWGTEVEVFYGRRFARFPLIHDTTNQTMDGEALIAITPMAWKMLGQRYAERWPGGRFFAPVAFRILGVARYMTDYRPFLGRGVVATGPAAS